MTYRLKMLRIKLLVYGTIALLALMSCKTRQAVVTHTIKETVVETVHDTTFVIEPDSSFYNAWIECKDGKPVLRNSESNNGKSLGAPIVKMGDDGHLAIKCEQRAQELFAQWKSTHKATVIEKEVPMIIEKPLTGWQVLLINLGKIFGVLLIVALGYSAFKIYKNVKK